MPQFECDTPRAVFNGDLVLSHGELLLDGLTFAEDVAERFGLSVPTASTKRLGRARITIELEAA